MRQKTLFHLVAPTVFFGLITGVLTAVVVSVYKLCAKHVFALSEHGYDFLRTHWYLLPAVLAALFGLAWFLGFVYRSIPNLRGGGIPTSIGVLRGIIPFRWLRNVVGVFVLSLSSFLVGVPLGNEGPSVQIGTAIGRGSVYSSGKRHRAFDRYAMTGGACAGFSVATGAPISGVLFAIEEAHQRLSPMILIVAATSVASAQVTAELLSPLLGVSTTLFPGMQLITLRVRELWIPLVLGIAVGLFAVLFLHYYRLVWTLFNKKLHFLRHRYKIFFVLVLTVAAGLCSFSFISTGHELILSLLQGHTAIYMLFLILLVRSTLTFCANTNRMTGGIFLPILAVGTVFSSLLGRAAEQALGLGHEYGKLILVLGITACIAGMMKMPLTAIVFALEALGCYGNILPVIIVSVVAFVITEIFGAESINDSVLEHRIEEMRAGKQACVIDTHVTVQPDAFAIGKQVRDIFWPANLFVLSLKHAEHRVNMASGGKAIRAGDVIHVRYTTHDTELTRGELLAIVGEQSYCENIVERD